MDLFLLEPEKYFSFPASYSREQKDQRLDLMVKSGQYMWSEKTDGNWCRFVAQGNDAKLQTRGISTKTGTYGEIQEKVLFFDALNDSVEGDTLLIGEVYLEGKIDKDVGAILRCLPPKALARQKDIPLKLRLFDVWVYDGQNLMDQGLEKRIAFLEKAVRAIDSPLVSTVMYYPLDETFPERLSELFDGGSEGVVITKKDKVPSPGKRPAWQTLKVKKEIAKEVDCIICGLEDPIRLYTGKYVESWDLWENLRTGELLSGPYFQDYAEGKLPLEPVTKGYFRGWPGAIRCGVYLDDGTLFEVCACSGLTDELKEELKNNYADFHHMPVKIRGMSISADNSIRHPKLVSLRAEDINPKDCTLSKMLNQE